MKCHLLCLGGAGVGWKLSVMTLLLRLLMLIPDCRRQQSCGGLEASVQLVHCPGCAGGAMTSTANTLLGAMVTLTDPAAATSTGQVRLRERASLCVCVNFICMYLHFSVCV